jgi:hypothetical protein
MAKPKKTKSSSPPEAEAGPVRPGSPLHRLMELVAAEVARGITGEQGGPTPEAVETAKAAPRARRGEGRRGDD